VCLIRAFVVFTGAMSNPRRATTEAPVVSEEVVAPVGTAVEL
jgi:hypothetical protein